MEKERTGNGKFYNDLMKEFFFFGEEGKCLSDIKSDVIVIPACTL